MKKAPRNGLRGASQEIKTGWNYFLAASFMFSLV
jgi:hypothetical protein